MPELKEKSLSLLSVTVVSLAEDADTTLYTVPSDKRCVLTHAVLVVGADAGVSELSIGANGTETDFIPAQSLDNLNAQYDAALLQPVPNTTPALMKSYAGSTVIQARVSSGAGSGSATNSLYLYGTLY